MTVLKGCLIISLLGCLRAEGKYLLVCGFRPQQYNPVNEVCINGHVVQKETTHAFNNSKTKTPNSFHVETEPISTLKQKLSSRTCRGNADFLVCNGKTHCGRDEGYKCCGFGIYKPRTQTCCQQANMKYKIHDYKPEKGHICCNLDVYERDSPSVTCQHIAANDKFFQPAKRLRKDQRICKKSNYVFRITVNGQVTEDSYITAEVEMWTWPPSKRRGRLRMSKSPARQKEMIIKLDKYTPKRNITKKSFLIFSKYNYLKDAVVILRPKEVLYRSPTDRKQTARELRKIHADCLVDLVKRLILSTVSRDQLETKANVHRNFQNSRRRERKFSRHP